MKLKKLFETMRKCKSDRKKYYIEKKVKVEVDDDYYIFYLLPTISVVPWTHRYNDTFVIDICWLNITIGLGIWRRKQ